MPEKAPIADIKAVAEESAASITPPPPPKRSPGHRGQDVRDTVAEMAAKAHEISLEAGSKMAAAMKDVINAAAGLTGFAVESARDLVQYMVRRGQMTQDEADKLIREAEEANSKRKPGAKVAASSARPPVAKPASSLKVEVAKPVTPKLELARVESPRKPAPPAVRKAAARAPRKAVTRAASAKPTAKPSAKARGKGSKKQGKR